MNSGTVVVSVTLLLSTGVAALAQAPRPLAAVAAVQQLQADYPEVQVHEPQARVTRLYGAPFGFGASPQDTAERFRLNYAEVFGTAPEELTPRSTLLQGADAQLLMFDRQTGTYKFTLLYYSQHRDGIPVFRAELRLLVRNTSDFPLVWASSTLKPLGDFVPPAAPVRFDPAAQTAVGMDRYGTPQTVIWAGANDQEVEPVLAVTFVGEKGAYAAGDYEKWRFLVDARTGEVLWKEDLIIFTDVTGSVQGMATEGPKSDTCANEVPTPMRWAKVSISGGSTAYTDVNGNFTIPNSGTSAVTVQSFMSGLHFAVDNLAGSEETLTLSVTPPGPANFLHNAANTSEQVRAQVNGYVQANVVRDFILTYNPTYPTISGESNFPVNVNSTNSLYCPGNAWYDYSAINFCQSGSGYPNTAYDGVVHHEYGHRVVEVGGSGQGAYGEGMGDCLAVLITDDPVMGYGFLGNCNTGIRTADNDCQYQSSGCSSCGSEIHDCGQLLSGCIWSTRSELAATHPADYLAIISNLTVDSILLHDGDQITPQITNDFLTLDDDDGNLGNGTPHYDEITAGFAAHNMWSEPPSDTCAAAKPACPGTYSGSTSGLTVDGSASCGSSNSTPDAWYKYKPASSGTLTLKLCGSAYDTVLSVHTGCPGTSGNQVACNDDTGWFGPCGWLPTSQSALSVSVTAGTLYYIRISGKNGATGSYTLEVSGPTCAPMETCTDGIQNQGEQRIDCGGPCPPCQCTSDPACANGVFCDGSETCDTYGHCQTASNPCGTGTWCYEDGDTCVSYGDGDFDTDGDVDLADFAGFQTCFTELGLAACQPVNLTGGGLVQLDDLAVFVSALTGP